MTERVGKEILTHQPNTLAGLMVLLHVIETHDELVDIEPAEAILTEIRSFVRCRA